MDVHNLLALHRETRLATLVGERGRPLVIYKSHDVGQPQSGAVCRWQVRIADGRYALSMAGMWCGSGCWVVAGLAGHCWVVGRCRSSCWVVAGLAGRHWV